MGEKINDMQCRSCIYAYEKAKGAVKCDYLEKVGRMRNCPTYPKCEKRVARRRKRK